MCAKHFAAADVQYYSDEKKVYLLVKRIGCALQRPRLLEHAVPSLFPGTLDYLNAKNFTPLTPEQLKQQRRGTLPASQFSVSCLIYYAFTEPIVLEKQIRKQDLFDRLIKGEETEDIAGEGSGSSYFVCDKCALSFSDLVRNELEV